MFEMRGFRKILHYITLSKRKFETFGRIISGSHLALCLFDRCNGFSRLA